MGTEGFLQRMLVSVKSWLCGCRTVLSKPRSSTCADTEGSSITTQGRLGRQAWGSLCSLAFPKETLLARQRPD